MKHLNAEHLTAVEDMASCLLQLPLIAVNLEIEEFELKEMLQAPTPLYRAYYRGFIRQKMEVQHSIIKAAQNGSNPALEQLLKMLSDISNQLKYG